MAVQTLQSQFWGDACPKSRGNIVALREAIKEISAPVEISEQHMAAFLAGLDCAGLDSMAGLR